jgi:hydrogenase/urease accessory protein HupE
MRALFLALALVLVPVLGQGHALQPGYVELRALGGDTWSVFWRKPDVQGSPMRIDLALSEPCQTRTGPAPQFDGEGWSAGWVAACPGGLGGVTVTIVGLEDTQTDVLMRYEVEPGRGEAWRFVPGATAHTIAPVPGAWDVLRSYAGLGVEHILFGLDHLLFVLALVLLIPRMRTLIGAITAFTVAHSLTLGAAALGWLNVPGPPVEAVIALSIMFLASEILHRHPDRPRLSERAPWVIAFGFGLIHGLGFGSALAEIGLPQGEIVLALLAFNIGVEIGQHEIAISCRRHRRRRRRRLGPLSPGQVRLDRCLPAGTLGADGGSSWHAAGGIHALNADPNMAALQAYTIDLLSEIQRRAARTSGCT